MKTAEQRFWEKVDPSGDCWLWTASQITNGYGSFWDGTKKTVAHRFAWETLVGPIPEGMQLDHLCRVRHCVKPDHMEVVTQRENNHRRPTVHRTVCSKGHGPYDLIYSYGRYCSTCKHETYIRNK